MIKYTSIDMQTNGHSIQEIFHSTTHGDVSLEQVIREVKSFLEEVPQAKYSLVIGTDSHEKTENNGSSSSLNLVTAVVVHRKGHGGKYFWKRRHMNKIHTLRDKIYAETMESLQFATFFVPQFKKALNGHSLDYDLEIHVDVGNHGETRDMIKEVVGMVTGNGFIAKTKPYSFGASYVADKHT